MKMLTVAIAMLIVFLGFTLETQHQLILKQARIIDLQQQQVELQQRTIKAQNETIAIYERAMK